MDIIERLSTEMESVGPYKYCVKTGHQLTKERIEAAAEITRLREENKRMREALTYFADRPTVSELMEGKHDPMPDTVAARIEGMGRRKREHDDAILKARTALATTGGE